MSETDNKDIIIQIKDLTKKFGDFYAVSNLNLEIKKGEILGFLGHNGAGKSTTMKMMAYLLAPTKGEILIRNNGKLEKLTRNNKAYLLDNVGFLIENPAFYGNITPRQILTYFAKLKGYPRQKIKERVEDTVAMMGMTNWIDKKVSTFSKGMRQKIGILSAIIHDPGIVVLDEPQTGLDPQARREVRNFMSKLKDMGKTIIFSTHLIYEVSEIADRVAIISKGKLRAFDTLENLELKQSKSVINFELLHPSGENLNEMLEQFNRILFPLTGLEDPKDKVAFKQKSNRFTVTFNGNPENQLKIHNALFENNYEIIEFSVPKASLLEDLFVSFTEDSDYEEINIENEPNMAI